MLLYKELFKYEYFRLSRIVIDNYKSIGHGIIEFKTNKEAIHSDNIICLYGANGTGKTSVAEIVLLFNHLVKGNIVNIGAYKNCISVGHDHAHILYEFEGFLKSETTAYKRQLTYEMDLVKRADGKGITLKNEILRVANIELNDTKKDRALLQLQPIFDTTESDYVGEGKLPFGPKSKITQLIEGQNYYPLHIIKQESFDKSKSFIFNKETLIYLIGHNYFGRVIKDDKHFVNSLGFSAEQIRMYAQEIEALASDKFNNQVCIFFGSIFELIRYGTECIDIIGYNGSLTAYTIGTADCKLKINEYQKPISVKNLCALGQHIDRINELLPHFLPGTHILYDKGSIETSNSSQKIEANFYLDDGTQTLPLSLISDGTKKIICYISALINAEGIDGHLIVVDDFDSQIFSPVLIKFINYIDSYLYNCQFILSMHNPITMDEIAKESVIFATADRDNRFVRAKQVKSCNSLMKLYLGSNPKISPDVTLFIP